MKRILITAAAAAAALAGSAAVAAPAMASTGPSPAVTANTHLNNHPDTTGFTAGAIVNNVWAYDNATEKFTVTPDGTDQYLVTMGYVGSFHGFADPRLPSDNPPGDGQGSALISDGSVKGTISYDVTVQPGVQPDPANLPGQSPSDAHIATNIGLLFDGQTTGINFIPGSYTFTYHKVAGADYTQVG